MPKLFRSIHKPIAQLTRCFIQSLDLECPLHVAFGGIAGLKNWQSTSGLFSGPNDGVVAVSSVYLEYMTDFIQMPCDHITIMKQQLPHHLELTFGDLDNSVTQLKSIVFNTLDQYPLQRISFVGHSTGGIAIRMLLKNRQIADKTYACVFVAVPNQGTVLADAHQTVP